MRLIYKSGVEIRNSRLYGHENELRVWGFALSPPAVVVRY